MNFLFFLFFSNPFVRFFAYLIQHKQDGNALKHLALRIAQANSLKQRFRRRSLLGFLDSLMSPVVSFCSYNFLVDYIGILKLLVVDVLHFADHSQLGL